jgi:hypothetical protein
MKEILALFILITLLYIVFWLVKLSIKIDYKENLTMEENPIKITIENYCGQIVTFTMSSEAEIESSLCIIDDKVTEVHINGYDKDILIEKEDI